MEFIHTHRRIALIILAIILLIASGVYITLKNKANDANSSAEADTLLLDNLVATPSGETKEEDSPSLSSNEHLIKRAFLGTGTASCSISISEGTAKMYVKKEMLRFTNIVPKNADEKLPDEILTLNATVWVWNTETKKGYMMSDLSGIYSSSLVLNTLYAASDEHVKEGLVKAGFTISDCVIGSVPETVFTLPTDVEFNPITEAIRNTLM